VKTLFLLAMSQPQGGSPEGSLISTLIMFTLIIAIFYFMILRPQQKRQKDRQKMLDAVKKGDKVVTSGGMHGTVAGIDEKSILVQVAENVKLKFDRTAIAAVVREGETPEK
jgi:preprotein translocase subunit YajC